jgi:hypothetical protein
MTFALLRRVLRGIRYRRRWDAAATAARQAADRATLRHDRDIDDRPRPPPLPSWRRRPS